MTIPRLGLAGLAVVLPFLPAQTVPADVQFAPHGIPSAHGPLDTSEMCEPSEQMEESRPWPAGPQSSAPKPVSECVPILEPCKKDSDCCPNPDPSGPEPLCFDFGTIPEEARPEGFPTGPVCVYPDA